MRHFFPRQKAYTQLCLGFDLSLDDPVWSWTPEAFLDSDHLSIHLRKEDLKAQTLGCGKKGIDTFSSHQMSSKAEVRSKMWRRWQHVFSKGFWGERLWHVHVHAKPGAPNRQDDLFTCAVVSRGDLKHKLCHVFTACRWVLGTDETLPQHTSSNQILELSSGGGAGRS